MTERKYYHLYADGKKVKEVSRDEWLKIVIKERDYENSKLVVTVYKDEISFNKGRNHIFLMRKQLEQIFSKEG